MHQVEFGDDYLWTFCLPFYVILELTAYPLSYRLLDLLIDGILEFFLFL